MLTDQNVLITGGTGSFGKRFIKHVLKGHKPRRLVVFSRDELKQHEMRVHGFNDPILRYFIGDVRDRDRLRRAMSGVDIVVHAAALKQVPACEYNPLEAIATNIRGAENVVEAAIDRNVGRVIALSTDKAVSPVNLYGATKLCAEKLFVQANAYSGAAPTRFSCVRYGNVVGSRGSVVPLFKEQAKSGILTITDDRMTRFWLTLDQAVQFVLKALSLMKGGEVFVPKIPSMRVSALAKAVGPQCRLKHVGIRPGEKLHEDLISETEARHTLEKEDLFVIQPLHSWWNQDDAIPGDSLPEGFQYRSDKNTQWLTEEQIREMI